MKCTGIMTHAVQGMSVNCFDCSNPKNKNKNIKVLSEKLVNSLPLKRHFWMGEGGGAKPLEIYIELLKKSYTKLS